MCPGHPPGARPISAAPADDDGHVVCAVRPYSESVNTVHELVQLTPVYELVDAGWTQARIAELPGVITAAPTREQAQDMLLDALREFLLSFGPGHPTPDAGVAEGPLILTVNLSSTPAA